MKVFISQPMAGKTGEEIIKERENIKTSIRNEYGCSVEFIKSFITEKLPESVTNQGVWYLGKSLECMSQADLVFFARDFEKARGCMFEFDIAMTYGMRVEKQK